MEDPDNVKEIVDIIPTLRTMKEVFELINNTFPTWIVTTAEEFSKDYPNLDNNWEFICLEKKTRKAKILIFKKISVDIGKDTLFSIDTDKHILTRIFSDLLTCCGFVVRDINDLKLCEYCKKAIPTEGVYNVMKAMDVVIPPEYSPNCSTCV